MSILAKVVSVRRGAPATAEIADAPKADGASEVAGRTSGSSSSLAIDPICGMTVAAVESTPSVQRDGETIYFCSEGCKAKFEAQGEHASLAG